MIVAARRCLALALFALFCPLAPASSAIIRNVPFDTAATSPVGALVVDAPGAFSSKATQAVLRRALLASVAGHGHKSRQSSWRWRIAPPPQATRLDGWLDRAVVLRRAGTLWLPGRWQSAKAPQATALTFAYQGWNSSELQTLQNYIAAAYPVIESVYGPPAASITVTIVKDTSTPSPYGGTYNASTNEIRMPGIDDPVRDTYVLASLILRAFHDDLMFDYDAWETGFARAAALVVQLQVSPDFDPILDSNPYVIPLYELFNQPALGNATFFPSSGYLGMTFWRIGMAQAAWLKVYAENPAFFRDFNAAYYAAYDPQAVPPLSGNIAALKQIAGGIVPTVEGLTFADWYRRQYVLDTSTSLGQKLLVATFPFEQYVYLELDYYQTDASGNETPLEGTATFRYLSYQGISLFSEAGDSTPVSDGIGVIAPEFFNIPTPQRITIEVALAQMGATTYFPYGVAGSDLEPNPFFGVITDVDSGTVGITLPGQSEQTTAAVRGAFSLVLGFPLDSFARVALRFTDESSRTYTRWINTGPGYYVPVLTARPGETVTLVHTFPSGTSMVGFPVRPFASDEAAALGIDPAQLLLAHWKTDLAGSRKYVYYPNTPPIEPQIGYWLNLPASLFPAGHTVQIEGVAPASDQPYTIHLLHGWNQVANPFTEEAPLTRMTVSYPGHGTVSYADAVARGWVNAPLRYVAGQPNQTATSIQAWESVWVYCHPSAELSLIITPG